MASTEQGQRPSALATWLFQRLPDYAQTTVDPLSGQIDWEHLLSWCRGKFFSTGERAAVALAAHLDDRPGIIWTALYGEGPAGSPVSVLALLGRIDRAGARDWLALLIARVEALPR